MRFTGRTLIRMLRVALTPRGRMLRTTLSNGAVVYGQNRAGYGGRGAYIYRDALEPELLHVEKFLEPGNVFVDIGANTGVYSLKAAKHVGVSGVVLAMEPFPEVLVALYRSIQANHFTNIRLRNLCAGDRTEARTLWMNFRKPNSASLLKRDPYAASLSTLVVSLDDLLGWEALDRLDYLKIDVEGAEHAVLAGAARTIERYRPIVQMEVTIADTPPRLLDYVFLRIPHSPNIICFPPEHPKIAVARELGWICLSA